MKKTVHKCEYCGRDFYGLEKVRFCSDECRKAAKESRLVKLTCECCGKTYMGTPLSSKRKHLYCSEECRRKMKNRAHQLKLIEERQKSFEGKTEGIDYVVCQICGYKALQINTAHLMNEHGITVEEYKKMFPAAQITAKAFVEEHLVGENNPMHTSKRTEEQRKASSPFSSEFYKARGLTEDDRRNFIDDVMSKKGPESYCTRLEYFLARGYTVEQAIEIRKQKHQFTLEKCITKYGIEEGTKVFQDRQERWMASMRSFDRHPSTITRGVSKVANDFIEKVLEGLDKSMFMYDRNEYHIHYCGSTYYYDLTCLDTKRIIEFNGDMWHGNPAIYTAAERNPFNHKLYEDIWLHDNHKKWVATSNGFKLYVVWESDYHLYPEHTVSIARSFLLGETEFPDLCLI